MYHFNVIHYLISSSLNVNCVNYIYILYITTVYGKIGILTHLYIQILKILTLYLTFILLYKLSLGADNLKSCSFLKFCFVIPTAANRSSAISSSHTTRILCWIMTGPKNLESRTRHIRESWAKRCNKVLYISSVETNFPTVGLNVSEGRNNLYWKTIRAFQYIHQHHLDEADWFLKADDDTFVVVENLIYILSKYDPEKPLYLGRRFAPFIKQGYMSGGAGYVLSKEALRRFVKGFSTGECTHFSVIEDMALGKCMEMMKVEPADSRDIKGRQTFHPYPPNNYLVRQSPRPRPWYLIYEYYPPIEVRNTLKIILA